MKSAIEIVCIIIIYLRSMCGGNVLLGFSWGCAVMDCVAVQRRSPGAAGAAVTEKAL